MVPRDSFVLPTTAVKRLKSKKENGANSLNSGRDTVREAAKRKFVFSVIA